MIKNINIKQLEINKGQIEGLPRNPRFIKDHRFEALKRSISDAPEMLALRELIVFPVGDKEDKFVVIGGNMRLRACAELGYKELPCKVLDKDTPAAKLREYAIKDNIGFGTDDWDILGDEWDSGELEAWGMEMMNSDWEQLERIESDDALVEKDDKIVVKISKDYDEETRAAIKQAVKDSVKDYDKCSIE